MAEPWIRCHARLYDRRVVTRAMRALRVDEMTAIGHLVTFWGAVSERVARGDLLDGDVARYSDDVLADMARWRGDVHLFATFVRRDHCDSRGVLNDFTEYFGLLAERRRKNRERMQSARKSLAAPPEAVDDEIDARIASMSGSRGRIPITPAERATCAYCGNKADRWDYVITAREGGKRQKSNIVPSCGRCVSERRDAPIESFLAMRGIEQDTWERFFDVDVAGLRDQFVQHTNADVEKSVDKPINEQKNTFANVQSTNENVQSTEGKSVLHNFTKRTTVKAKDQKQDQKLLAGDDLPAKTGIDASHSEMPSAREDSKESDHTDYISALPPKVKRKLNRFIERFYENTAAGDIRVVDVLGQINRGLSRQGVMLKGERILIEPAPLGRALDDMPESMDKPDSAIVMLLMKLHSGKANHVTAENGELRTENVSRETKALESQPISDPNAAALVSALANGKSLISNLHGAANIPEDIRRRLEQAERDIRREMGMAQRGESQNGAHQGGASVPVDQNPSGEEEGA